MNECEGQGEERWQCEELKRAGHGTKRKKKRKEGRTMKRKQEE
jgi:hypothetical protein